MSQWLVVAMCFAWFVGLAVDVAHGDPQKALDAGPVGGQAGLPSCMPFAEQAEGKRRTFTRVELQGTLNGLSGLDARNSRELWTIAERHLGTPRPVAYRIELDAKWKPSIQPFEIQGVPRDLDLEGITILDKDASRFAMSAEAQDGTDSAVLMVARRGKMLVVDEVIPLKGNLALRKGQGAEGICGDDKTLFVAMESVQDHGTGHRWAPILRVERKAITHIYKLRLRSRSGKLSTLDCEMSPDGKVVSALAIERDFGVRKVLRFSLEGNEEEITPQEQDLEALLYRKCPGDRSSTRGTRADRCSPNLEGIAWTSDCNAFMIVDNEEGSKPNGKSELLVFEPPSN